MFWFTKKKPILISFAYLRLSCHSKHAKRKGKTYKWSPSSSILIWDLSRSNLLRVLVTSVLSSVHRKDLTTPLIALEDRFSLVANLSNAFLNSSDGPLLPRSSWMARYYGWSWSFSASSARFLRDKKRSSRFLASSVRASFSFGTSFASLK